MLTKQKDAPPIPPTSSKPVSASSTQKRKSTEQNTTSAATETHKPTAPALAPRKPATSEAIKPSQQVPIVETKEVVVKVAVTAAQSDAPTLPINLQASAPSEEPKLAAPTSSRRLSIIQRQQQVFGVQQTSAPLIKSPTKITSPLPFQPQQQTNTMSAAAPPPPPASAKPKLGVKVDAIEPIVLAAVKSDEKSATSHQTQPPKPAVEVVVAHPKVIEQPKVEVPQPAPAKEVWKKAAPPPVPSKLTKQPADTPKVEPIVTKPALPPRKPTAIATEQQEQKPAHPSNPETIVANSSESTVQVGPVIEASHKATHTITNVEHNEQPKPELPQPSVQQGVRKMPPLPVRKPATPPVAVVTPKLVEAENNVAKPQNEKLVTPPVVEPTPVAIAAPIGKKMPPPPPVKSAVKPSSVREQEPSVEAKTSDSAVPPNESPVVSGIAARMALLNKQGGLPMQRGPQLMPPKSENTTASAGFQMDDVSHYEYNYKPSNKFAAGKAVEVASAEGEERKRHDLLETVSRPKIQFERKRKAFQDLQQNI